MTTKITQRLQKSFDAIVEQLHFAGAEGYREFTRGVAFATKANTEHRANRVDHMAQATRAFAGAMAAYLKANGYAIALGHLYGGIGAEYAMWIASDDQSFYAARYFEAELNLCETSWASFAKLAYPEATPNPRNPNEVAADTPGTPETRGG